MPPRKSTASTTSNAAGDEGGADHTPSQIKASKDGLGVDDLSLPKSMIARLAKGVLPANTQIHRDALLALHKSATVFVSYIASNSNELAQAGGKKTISPQDVMASLKDAELEAFLPRLEAELRKYNDTQCDKRNSYRHRVKQEKAAAAAAKGEGDGDGDTTTSHIGGDTTMETDDGTNGHAEGDGGERPSKKLKGVQGAVAAPLSDPEDDSWMDDEGKDGEQGDDDDNDVDDDDDDDVEADEDEDDSDKDDVVHDDLRSDRESDDGLPRGMDRLGEDSHESDSD